MDKEKLTAHLQGEHEQTIGAIVLDAAKIAWNSNRHQITNFFDPYEQKVARSVLSGLPELNVLTFGGHRRAERARLAIVPHFIITETVQPPICVLQASGNFNFAKVGHGDFLGSLLGLGIKREKVGDIIVLDDGCQVVVAKEIMNYVIQNWSQVHQVSITIEEIDPEQIAIEPERVREIRTTVASLRLDAVASSGYGTSRTKIARDIRGERVKLNWKTVANPASEVKEGDTLSIRGRGRVIVEEVRGETRKGRISLVLKRLL